MRAWLPGLLAIAVAALAPPGASAEDRIDSSQLTTVKNSIGMNFVHVPAGDGVVGSSHDEPGRGDNEPRRAVRFRRGFYLGAWEVTQSQFAAVMAHSPSAFSRSGDRGSAVEGIDTSNFPVESVAWAGAVEFCRRLSELPDERRAGRSYRLPTEAEWEYACRAGAASVWSFGDDPARLADYAWFGRQTCGNRPHQVGTKRPNRWGLYDMHGNVWEWCADIDMTDEHARFIRGGSWFSPAASTRCAKRVDDPAAAADPDTGFRVLLEP